MRNRAKSSSWQRAIEDGKFWTETEAREALEACASSGESIWVFARRHGMTPERLYRWKRLLKKSARRTREVRAPLIPVTVRAPREGDASERVVVVDGELRVEVGDTSAVSPTWVATLLRLVREGRA